MIKELINNGMIIIYPIKTKKLEKGDNLKDIILENIPLKPKDKDIIVIASKPILITLGYTISLNNITIEKNGYKLAQIYDVHPGVVQLVLKYSNNIYGGVKGFLLAEIDGVFLPNAGIDMKNVGEDKVTLPPIRLSIFAKEIYDSIYRIYGVKVGVIISDSTVFPLRKGTRAVALYTYGFEPIKNYVNKEDLYKRKIKFTKMSLADEIASASHLVLGEGDEGIPAALIRGVNIFMKEEDTSSKLKIKKEECLYKELYKTHEPKYDIK